MVVNMTSRKKKNPPTSDWSLMHPTMVSPWTDNTWMVYCSCGFSMICATWDQAEYRRTMHQGTLWL